MTQLLINIYNMSQIKGKQIKDNSISKSKLDFDLSYTHVQSVSLSTWNITHTLDKYTNVTIYDASDNVIEGEINYISNSQLQIKFNTSLTGKVILS